MINTFLRVTKVLPAGTANFPPVPLDPKIWEQRGESLIYSSSFERKI
jgi:hypothetical protein